jgi:hypothetical protein
MAQARLLPAPNLSEPRHRSFRGSPHNRASAIFTVATSERPYPPSTECAAPHGYGQRDASAMTSSASQSSGSERHAGEGCADNGIRRRKPDPINGVAHNQARLANIGVALMPQALGDAAW